MWPRTVGLVTSSAEETLCCLGVTALVNISAVVCQHWLLKAPNNYQVQARPTMCKFPCPVLRLCGEYCDCTHIGRSGSRDQLCCESWRQAASASVAAGEMGSEWGLSGQRTDEMRWSDVMCFVCLWCLWLEESSSWEGSPWPGCATSSSVVKIG